MVLFILYLLLSFLSDKWWSHKLIAILG